MLFINAIVSASVAGAESHSEFSFTWVSAMRDATKPWPGLSQAPTGKLGAWNEEFSFAKAAGPGGRESITMRAGSG